MKMKMISVESVSGCRSHRGASGGWSFHYILYSVLLLGSEEMHGLSDFSTYLFRIIISHSAHARDGELLLLSCPRHSTISVQSAFYRPHAPRTYCNAPTALQMLSECQDRRNCQVLVNYRLFGLDPCPGTTKHLHVSYSCKPTENKNRTRCEGDQMLLHCKYPKLLNIYSAVYGRELGEKAACLTEEEQPPPFECLYHGALDTVKNLCYGKQRCLFIINDQQFRNPCMPETKKYLSVVYSCVPQSLLKEADPQFFQTTTIPQKTTRAVFTGKRPDVRESRLPDKNGNLVSNSLMAYGYIKEHPEKVGLLFVSSVCLGLFLVLLAISMRITCTRHHEGVSCRNKKTVTVEPKDEDNDEDSDDEESEPLMDRSTISEVGRKVYCWEEAMYTTEAAELIERLERREMIIQEIRMNAYLNGTSCTLH
ncbi:protein eva-1 homolog C isoform X2 [Neoarius graeffei]|uniref:protein eva-1 homolog C isoform X2 n=1 Tax=Neoarius graeffei TaxID=443677 RepID=UPI00298C95CA|nr:protein eva-1 homolog C isoform X2 [Neoarius graeffei]